MSKRAAWMLTFCIFFWSSAFVGIRIALHGYTPGGLALLRYLIASCCMGFVYFLLPKRTLVNFRDKILIMLAGAIGIGFYNLTLNYGEIAVQSAMASFIISMSPVVASLLAVAFLGERLSVNHIIGLIVSVGGVLFIALNEGAGFSWSEGLIYILLATVAGSCYSVMQKPFALKYNAIEVTTYAIWGGAISLLFYLPALRHEFVTASSIATWTVVYLAVFPAALGYLCWSYVLSEVPASRAVTYLYVQPFIVTLLGWVTINEMPSLLTLCGGAITVAGVWIVNRPKKIISSDTIDIVPEVDELDEPISASQVS